MITRVLKLVSLATFGLFAAADALMLHPSARAVEVITLRSGYDEANSVPLANGVADTNISQISGTSPSPLSAAAFTAADFSAARSGGTAFTTAPHSAWLPPASFTDTQARWINWVPSTAVGRSALYAMPFNITTTGITNATLSFDWAIDDVLGDTGGSPPNPAGVYIGAGTAAGIATTPLISGGALNVASSATVNITSLVQTGPNYLYVYQRDLGAAASGTIFSATVTVVPEPTIAGALVIGSVALLMRRPRRA